MPLATILHTTIYAIAFIALLFLGVLWHSHIKKERSHYMTLSKEEWLDDNDMLPKQDTHKDNETTRRPPKPTKPPINNSDFFGKVTKARNKTENHSHFTVVHKKVNNTKVDI